MPAARLLPAWAVEPLDMDGAARALGISRRTLTDKLAEVDRYTRAANRRRAVIGAIPSGGGVQSRK